MAIDGRKFPDLMVLVYTSIGNCIQSMEKDIREILIEMISERKLIEHDLRVF